MHLSFSETTITSIMKIFVIAAALTALVGIILFFGKGDLQARVFGTGLAVLSALFLWGCLRLSWLKRTKAAAVIATGEEVVFNSPLWRKRVRFEDLVSVNRLSVAPQAGPVQGKRSMEIIRLTRRSGGVMQVPLNLLSDNDAEVEKWMRLVTSKVKAQA
ncbi:hypothetical protein [Sphingomonas astaxanthinifaciens]|uniref:PH domain-containing protein n=1 Tax=Sphingomonas astaxanthinifaciens DSM 22298 TaxID=1123267 RepID=A0ABQ5Z7N2_9SPHN|nr:hypothetical protein [Sphingomonas astaxanthinifaciens]GLR48794.1 hypothetical protein GCM10007925_25190 [Sphingomonas astaxanthinifaciens DSM 22298]